LAAEQFYSNFADYSVLQIIHSVQMHMRYGKVALAKVVAVTYYIKLNYLQL